MADSSRDPTIGCVAAPNLCGHPSRQVSATKRNLLAHLPWALATRLEQLHLLLLITNVSNKSGICLSRKRKPNRMKVLDPCTVGLFPVLELKRVAGIRATLYGVGTSIPNSPPDMQC